MKVITLLIIFVLGLSGCRTAGTSKNSLDSEKLEREQKASFNLVEAQEVTNSLLEALRVKIPEHLKQENATKDGTEFGMGEFFRVFQRLSMVPGWSADYDYHFDGMGGRPVVYAHGPHGEKEELFDYVKTDGTADGFFQLAMLKLMHDQFYIFWHAAYGQIVPVLSGKDIKDLPEEIVLQIDAGDVTPTIEIRPDGEFIASIVVFNMWIGLIRIPIHMSADFPHRPKIFEDGVSLLVQYDCGIAF